MLDLGKLRVGIEVASDAAKQQLNNFAGEADKAQSKIGGKFQALGGKIGKALKVGAAAAAAAVAAAVVKISKEALKAYAEFEQLEGGVQKIFGDDAAQAVMENAQNAWKTAGMSANQYMETATSFSASLINSLGGDTQKAAEITDMAIQDMADNANVFGSNISDIERAYQGFARGNFGMLDNLKLGYGGTKEEMERLLADAEEISGIHYDINNLSDMYNAIHVVQEEMHITGTTGKEAMDTIEGSVNATKAAWQNFLTGLGDENADMEGLITNLLTSVGAAIKNIVPRLGKIVQSLVKSVISIAKNHATNGLDGIISSVVSKLAALPGQLLSMLGGLLNKLADALEGEGGGKFSSSAAKIVMKMMSGVAKALPGLIKGIIRLAVALLETSLGIFVKEVGIIMGKIKEAISKAWESIKKKLSEKLKPVVESKAVQTLISWVKSAINWWNDLKAKLKNPISAIIHTKRKGSSGGDGGSVNGNYQPKRTGLKEVPYDNYKASLHKGEAVLTAAEANIWKKFIGGGLKTDDEPRTIIQETSPATTYNFGNITVDVSSLKDLTTVEDFVDMMTRAKQFA